MFVDDEDCPECDEILEELEMIDDEADLYGELKSTYKVYFTYLIAWHILHTEKQSVSVNVKIMPSVVTSMWTFLVPSSEQPQYTHQLSVLEVGICWKALQGVPRVLFDNVDRGNTAPRSTLFPTSGGPSESHNWHTGQ